MLSGSNSCSFALLVKVASPLQYLPVRAHTWTAPNGVKFNRNEVWGLCYTKSEKVTECLFWTYFLTQMLEGRTIILTTKVLFSLILCGVHFWPTVFLPPSLAKLQLERAADDEGNPFPCFRRTGTPRSQPSWSTRTQLKLVLHRLSLMKVLSYHKYCIFPGCSLVVNQVSAHPFIPGKAWGKSRPKDIFSLLFLKHPSEAHILTTHTAPSYITNSHNVQSHLFLTDTTIPPFPS